LVECGGPTRAFFDDAPDSLRFDTGAIIFLIQVQDGIMIDIADLQQEIDRLAASVEAFGPASDQAERGRLRAQLRRVLEQLQRLDETATERAARSADGRVESTIGDEEAAAKTLIPRVLRLRRYLTGTSRLDDPEAHELLEKAIDIAASCQSLHRQLIEAPGGGGPSLGNRSHAPASPRPITRS
jgi:hypothetical protein